MSKKQSVLLGLRDKTEKDFKNMLADMHGKFKNNQGIFAGERRTYDALDGFADDDTKRGFKNVESTVADQLKWFKDHTADYLKTALSIEKTNAQNIQAELIVKGESWGKFTTLELLRMKGILDGLMRAMIDELPIRSEKQIWKLSEQSDFAGRGIWETEKINGFAKTTLKRRIIVLDPHVKDAEGRQPITDDISEQVNVGAYSVQSFTGAITNLEKAQLKVKYNNIHIGIIEALESANNVDSVESDLGDRVLDYLF